MNVNKKARFIDAAIKIWGAKGQFAVTTQAVGAAVGVSKQRVSQFMGTAENMRSEAALEAIRRAEIAVIIQLINADHPLSALIPASVKAKVAEITSSKAR